MNWVKIIEEHKNQYLTDSQKKQLLKTAKVAEALGDKIYSMSIPQIVSWCEKSENAEIYRTWDYVRDELFPEYTRSAWSLFFSQEPVAIKIREEQNKQIEFDTRAALVASIGSGELKDIKDIAIIKQKTEEKPEQVFVFSQVPSIYEENKLPMTHVCPNCNQELLCTTSFVRMR